MASLNNLYLKLDTLKTLVSTLESKGEKGISLTVSVNDEVKSFEGKNNNGESYTTHQNVSAFVAQNEEDRAANKPRFYVGNGKTFWANGVQLSVKDLVDAPVKAPQPAVAGVADFGDLPF